MFKTNATFSKNLDRATSNLLLSPDWDAILAICDTLRQGDCAPKPAVEAIRKKLQDKNPHVALYSLQVLDAVVKNCGKPIHDEVMTMSFMEELKDMAKRGPDEVRNRVLEVIQCWAHGFREKPQYRIANDTVSLMKLEGYKFPVMREADALFVAESAPDWLDGDCCHRCRADFSLTNRRHHCRNCGQIFCSKCSAKVSPLPHYGIEKEVRVCDPCFDTINQPKTPAQATSKENHLPPEYLNSSLSKEPQAPVKKTKEEIEEEEELQLALAISQSEAEAKTKPKTWTASVKQETSPVVREDPLPQKNGHLDKYLNRQYWEEKQKDMDGSLAIAEASQPSAPTPSSTPSLLGTGRSNSTKWDESYQNGELDEIEQFMTVLKSQLNIFTNRIRSNVNRRRPLSTDPTVTALFNNLLPMRQQLMDYIQTQEHWKEYYERIQEKLIRLKEAREALDTLREEHREEKRREAEEKHRLMQMQMVAKLDALRMKKREYLEYQRQMAFQQMQAQEEEFMRRKQMTSYQPYAFLPGALAPRPQGAYPGQGVPPSYGGGSQAPSYHNPPPQQQQQQQGFQPIAQPPYYAAHPQTHYQPQPTQEYQPPPQTGQYAPYNVAMPGGAYSGGGYPHQPINQGINQGINHPYAAQLPPQAFQPIPQQQQQQQSYYTGHVAQQQAIQQQEVQPSVVQTVPVTEEQPLISFD